MPSPSKRDLIVDEALKLFYRHGFHATGVDRIIAQAQVSKKPLSRELAPQQNVELSALPI